MEQKHLTCEDGDWYTLEYLSLIATIPTTPI